MEKRGRGRPAHGHEAHKARARADCPACRIRLARERLGYDRPRMATALGVHERTVQRWELEELPVPLMALALAERMAKE